jgi:5'-nucleotidase (lipoprotein e(P4) family)
VSRGSFIVPICCAIVALAQSPPASPQFRVTHENLNAVLWTQASAEYQAVATQTYRAAQGCLLLARNSPCWTAAVEQVNGMECLPPAVILDVDDTVLDNSAYQAWLVKNNGFFDPKSWFEWVRCEEAAAIPGAVEFTCFAVQHQVAVYFMTNRLLAEKPFTVRNLAKLGFPVAADGNNVLCKGECPLGESAPWPSDKTPRRRYLAKSFRILLQMGDQLSDFVSCEGKTSKECNDIAKQYSSYWGTKWFALPNPTYGVWEQSLLLSPTKLADDEVLNRKRAAMHVWSGPH